MKTLLDNVNGISSYISRYFIFNSYLTKEWQINENYKMTENQDEYKS